MKSCKECSILKNIEEFKKDPSGKDGRRNVCKECHKKKQQKQREDRRNGIGITLVTSKQCNRCSQIKPSSDYFKDSGCTDGLSTLCKICRNDSMNAYRDKNRDKYNAYMREMRSSDKETFKDIDLRRTYGIGLEDYNRMLANQSNVCKICKNPAKGKRPLVVDHCHKTDRIRGLLCYGCNRLIVTLDDHPLHDVIMEYLKAA